MPKRHVLVVEDDPEIRKLLRKFLAKLDFEVTEAGTGRAALRQLGEGEVPALICLDLMLPESSGYEICEHVRKTPRLKHAKVLVISARSMPPDRALAEELGADAYLIKPIRWNSFAATVQELVGS
jgi:two-component system chemotaxis response regulator CheY